MYSFDAPDTLSVRARKEMLWMDDDPGAQEGCSERDLATREIEAMEVELAASDDDLAAALADIDELAACFLSDLDMLDFY